MKILSSISKIIFNRSAFLYLFSAVLILTILSCSTAKNSLIRDNDNSEKHSTISILAGLSSGGHVDNTIMSGINDVSNIDAVTGATKTRFNAGIHTEINLKSHYIETGLDYISFDQSVEYKLPSFSVAGNRDFNFHQLRLPLTYNLHLFKNSQNYPLLILKAGMSVGYTFSESVTHNGNIPDYKFTKWDYGPTIGIAVYPIQFKQSYRMGIYMDLYRGSQIYEDIYHQSEGMGGHSFIKFGIVIQALNLN
jgi:hypothetical protein